jgi:uncharacterized membrane protein
MAGDLPSDPASLRKGDPEDPTIVDTADPGTLHLRPGSQGVETWTASVQLSARSGPLPSPNELREFEAVFPGAAKKLFDELTKQGNHRRAIELLNAQTGSRIRLRGQAIAGLLGVVGITGGVVVASMGQSMAGYATVLTTLGSLVGIFIYSNLLQRKELDEKARIRARISKGEPVAEITDPRPRV